MVDPQQQEPQEPEETQEFSAGYESANSYATPSCNPHRQNTPEWKQWNAGFAKRQRQIDKAIVDRFLSELSEPSDLPGVD